MFIMTLLLTFANGDNKGIIPEVKLVPEAKLRDTNTCEVLFPLSILGCKHILMAQSIAEGPIFYLRLRWLCIAVCYSVNLSSVWVGAGASDWEP